MESQGMDNKFKFITVAAARCNQLQRGARPKVETRSHKNATIAQEEVRKGLIEFRIPEDHIQVITEAVDRPFRPVVAEWKAGYADVALICRALAEEIQEPIAAWGRP